MMSTYTNYQLIVKDLQKSLARTASDPVISRETDYYLKNIENIKSVDDFMKDRRIYNYAMKAFGLEDMAYAKAFMRKLLTEGIDDEKSFANRLADERYKELVKVFNFARYGELTTSFDAARQGVVDNYVRQSLEISAGEDDQGVRLALYFERKAASIKNPFDILADPALAQVVRTALGLPEAMAMANVDAQASMIERRLDIESLKDPKELQKFIKRFTTLWDAQNNMTTSPVLTLFTGASASSGINADLLFSLQNIKKGNF